jgi:hypothetical protein
LVPRSDRNIATHREEPAADKIVPGGIGVRTGAIGDPATSAGAFLPAFENWLILFPVQPTPKPASLGDLLAKAEYYANHCMRNTGELNGGTRLASVIGWIMTRVL